MFFFIADDALVIATFISLDSMVVSLISLRSTMPPFSPIEMLLLMYPVLSRYFLPK